MVALLAGAQRPSVRHLSLAAFAFLLGFAPVAASAALLLHFTVLDSIALAQMFQVPGENFRGLIRGLYFFGLISPPLLILGALGEMRPLNRWQTILREKPKRLWRFVLLILYPAAVLIYAAYAASEMRYFFPLLLPVFALHGGKGVELIVRAFGKSGAQFGAAIAFTVAAAIVLAAPPLLTNVRDGPASLTGGIWSPMLWQRWQSLQERSLDRTEAIVSDARRRQRTVLVTSSWNDEFYTRLRLMEAGFRSVETSTAFPGCGGFATYRRGGSTVLHIRLWPQYWRSPFGQAAHAALFLTTAYNCPAVRNSQNIWLTNFGSFAVTLYEKQGLPPLRFQEALELPVPTHPFDRYLRRYVPTRLSGPPGMPLLAARRMSAGELAELARRSEVLLPGTKPLSATDRAGLIKQASEAYRIPPRSEP
jgi:hypothetical protein